MEIKWELTEYGYELIEEYSNNQIALLKQDLESKEFYLLGIDNFDVGRNYLGTKDLGEAKALALETVIDKRLDEIKDLQNQVEELKKLLK